MGRINHLILLIATMAALPTGTALSNAEECPLDRVTFVDTKTGNMFVAKRVAVFYTYECATGWTKEIDHPSKDCPLDRLTFVDSTTGRAFVAKQVAARLVYECPSGFTKVLQEPLRDDAGCRWFGDWIVDGSLEGRRIFAVFTNEDSSPCCGWRSYTEASAPSEVREAKWLMHDQVPVVSSVEESATIAGNPPLTPDEGPMGGGEFVAATCRTGE